MTEIMLKRRKTPTQTPQHDTVFVFWQVWCRIGEMVYNLNTLWVMILGGKSEVGRQQTGLTPVENVLLRTISRWYSNLHPCFSACNWYWQVHYRCSVCVCVCVCVCAWRVGVCFVLRRLLEFFLLTSKSICILHQALKLRIFRKYVQCYKSICTLKLVLKLRILRICFQLYKSVCTSRRIKHRIFLMYFQFLKVNLRITPVTKTSYFSNIFSIL